MSATALITIAIVILAGIIAAALYKTGFRLEELKLKLPGLGEAKLARKPVEQAEQKATAANATSTPGVEQTQQASGAGSRIEDSPQQAAGEGVQQTMRAGDGGQIIGSGQTATGPARQQQQASGDGVIKNSQQRVE